MFLVNICQNINLFLHNLPNLHNTNQYLYSFQTYYSSSLDGDIGEGSWGKYELIESSKERSHEGMGFGNINFSSIVDIEFSPGSWEELSHI